MAIVEDCINDAPALVQGNVAIAIGTGTNLAIATLMKWSVSPRSCLEATET